MRRPAPLVLLVTVLLAAGPVRAQDPASGALSGSIHGVDSDLLATVQIVAFDPDSTDAAGNFSRYAVPADPDGTYRIDGMAAGSYLVVARSPEFETQFFDRAESPADATPVDVTAGDEISGIDFWLYRPSSGTGSISGTVVAEADGSPVAARILVTPASGPEILFSTVTNRSGQYAVEGLATGSYVVSAHAEGYVTEFYEDALRRSSATPVPVVEPGETAGIDFALAKSGAITGQVLDRDGLPFEGALVAVRPVAPGDSTAPVPPDSAWTGGGIGPDGTWVPDWTGSFQATTGPSGRYRIDGLPPGLYLVAASGRTPWRTAVVWFDGVTDPGLATPVGVRKGSTVDGINFVLPLASGEGAIAGTVRDAAGDPVAGAWISAVDLSSTAPSECCPERGGTTTDREGRYVLPHLPPGVYLVRAVWSGPWEQVVRWYPDSTTPAEAEPVPVERDRTTTGIDITIPVNEAGVSISGTVKDTDGNPLVWARVMVQNLASLVGELDARPITAWAWTDSLGAYTVRGLPAMSYLVSASWWDGDRFAQGWYDGVETFEEATPVDVQAGGEAIGIDFTLDPEYWYGGIGGRVVDDAGNPLDRAFVQVHPMSAEAGYAPFRYREPYAVTDAEGRFAIGHLPVGEYLLRAFADGAFAWYDGVPVAAWATPVPVTGGDTTGVVMQLESRSDGLGSIEGRVVIDRTVDWASSVTGTGDTVPPIAVVMARPTVTILVWPRSERFYPAVTRVDGAYAIAGLPPGEYLVRAFAPDFVPEWYDDAYDPAAADPVKVDGLAPATGIDFALIPMWWLAAQDGAERSGLAGIRGGIVDESGSAVGDATVLLMNLSGVAVASTRTAGDGTYVLEGLMPGAYRIMVSKEGFAASFSGGAASLDAAQVIELDGATVVMDITLRSSTSTGVEDRESLPGTFALRGNYPNPFNPSTTVLVDLPEISDVRVEVFDLLGRRVLEVHAGVLPAGQGRAMHVDGSVLASGVYLYRVRARGLTTDWQGSGRMTVVK